MPINIYNGDSLSATTISATTFYGDGSRLTGTSFTGGTITGKTYINNTLEVGDVGSEDGDIRINGTQYSSTLKISDIDGTNFAQTILHRHSTTLEPLIVGARSNSDTIYHTGVTNNMNVFTIYGAGWNTASYNLNGQISIATDDVGTLSNTSSPGKLEFYTTPNGSVWPELAMKIDSSKNVKLFGSLTANTISATTYSNLPTDVRVTGATYSNNTFTFTNNTGGTFSTLFNTVTGLTANGNIIVTGQTSNTIYTGGSLTSTFIPNWNNSAIQSVTLTASTTSVSGGTNLLNGGVYTLIVSQGGAGSKLISWAGAYKWAAGTAPTLTTTSGSTDIITFISDGTNLYGTIIKDFR